ncbi:hypothetical protein IQ07DRAFT_119079 [Pyrenochaeta sp. DS3sAY3a]|nr:hypothetical protein IQ07DRAFT_119079 [Pyrenochaeta sp. DS3sAY3a]
MSLSCLPSQHQAETWLHIDPDSCSNTPCRSASHSQAARCTSMWSSPADPMSRRSNACMLVATERKGAWRRQQNPKSKDDGTPSRLSRRIAPFSLSASVISAQMQSQSHLLSPGVDLSQC